MDGNDVTAQDTSPIRPEEVEAWRGHVGRQEIRRQRLDVESLRRFAAAQGASLDVEADPPPLAHWAWFLETAGAETLGADGHPRRGGLMPPVRLPRRMFAASVIDFSEPLALDEAAELSITIADVRHRAGKTGDLVFVETDRRLTQEGRTRLAERQTIVFRGLGERTPPVVAADPLPSAPGAETWSPRTADLFRFSAATFNSHRIHYDLPYTRDEEGYPDLIVHGPFTAARLFGFARGRATGPIRRFSFRALSPLFAGQPILLAPGEGPGEVQAIRADGAVSMTARADV
jgi:3-methylfumaryl-CoA hydratase